jgi:hypothetical protein
VAGYVEEKLSSQWLEKASIKAMQAHQKKLAELNSEPGNFPEDAKGQERVAQNVAEMEGQRLLVVSV